MNRRALLAFGLGALMLGGATTWRWFDADMRGARARLANRSSIATSRFGTIEYAIAGTGPPVLMIHGTGGGFDQGLAFARPLIDAGYKVVSPSRFGYLRSTYPSDPSSENQADALIDLLNALGIERIPVIGGSAGALPALAFAIRHSDRCAALLPIVPAAYAPNRPRQEPLSPLAAAIIESGLKSDFLFWLGLKTAERSMIATLLATDPEVVAHASAAEQARARAILWDILPVSVRANGLRNDAFQTSRAQAMALDRITAPTLTISLEDDRFGTYAAARHIAANVRGAHFISYPTGGHIWIGHNHDLFGEIDAFLRAL